MLNAEGVAVWSAWYDKVSWAQASNETMTVEWNTQSVPSADYRVEVRVVSEDQKTVYSSMSAPIPAQVIPR